MRRSFSGLSILVRTLLHHDPLDGHVYIFFNKAADQVRLLYFDRGGYCLWGKRLERGCFKVPWRGSLTGMTWRLDACELALILEGIELAGSHRRKRWTPEPAASN